MQTGSWMMLLGTFGGVRLSAEGLLLPHEWRPGLERGLVMTRGLDGCVAVFPLGVWEGLLERINKGTSFLREATRVFQRHTYGGATLDFLGADGMIKVPDHLRKYGQLGDEVVLVGVGSRFEIWNPERWSKVESIIEEQAKQFSEELSEYGI